MKFQTILKFFYLSETKHDSTYNHANVSIVEGISLSPTNTTLNMSEWMNLWTAQDSNQNYHVHSEIFNLSFWCDKFLVLIKIYLSVTTLKEICSDNIRVLQKCHNFTQKWASSPIPDTMMIYDDMPILMYSNIINNKKTATLYRQKVSPEPPKLARHLQYQIQWW